MVCPECGATMESRHGDICGIPVLISLCVECMTTSCLMMGDETPIFENALRGGRVDDGRKYD